jgi:TRAP-type C4-dicarboxylate transport system substrate-binding protein
MTNLRAAGWVLATSIAAAMMPATVQAQDVTLRMSNWLPEGQTLRVQAIEPWIAEVEKVTEGRVKIDVPPKVIGSVPAQFDVVSDGQADLALWVNGYTPGRFVISEIFELPFINDDPEEYSAVMYKFYQDKIAQYDEYAGTHVLMLFSPGSGPIFNTVRPVEKVADLEGLKLRSPQPVVTEALQILGAVPISKPVSELYELISSKVVDGTVLPMESVVAFKLNDLLSYGTGIPGGLYNTVLVLGINVDSWDRISEADQKAITAISGEKFARAAGGAYKHSSEAAKQKMVAEGMNFITADDAFVADLKQKLAPIEQSWIDHAKERGVEDPAALLAELRKVAGSKAD